MGLSRARQIVTCEADAELDPTGYTAPMSERRSSEVPNYIRAWREHRAMTLEQVAEKIGYEKMTLSRWERGQRVVTVDQLHKIADALHCTLYDLLYRNPEEAIDLFKAWADMPADQRGVLSRMLRGLVDDDENAGRKTS